VAGNGLLCNRWGAYRAFFRPGLVLDSPGEWHKHKHKHKRLHGLVRMICLWPIAAACVTVDEALI
jgi:hypothetical protein